MFGAYFYIAGPSLSRCLVQDMWRDKAVSDRFMLARDDLVVIARSGQPGEAPTM
jgi:hypothetical protein